MTPLNMAVPGEALRVCQIDAEGDDAVRVKRLGICVGHPLLLVQNGDPLIVQVVGARIGISRQIARRILVQPDSQYADETEPRAERLTA